MIDSVIKGDGDSRYLKSVSNFLTLYPTYADFVAALVAGTLPIDLNGINVNGFTTVGTPLNKSTLLSDTTAAACGLSSSATPNDAFGILAVNKADLDSPAFVGDPTAPTPASSSDADKLATTSFVHALLERTGKPVARVKVGSYTGTGTYGSNNPNSISSSDIDGQPIILILFGTSAHATYFWGRTAFAYGSGTCTVSTNGTTTYTYTATKSMIYNGQVSRYHGASELFGTDEFYGSNSVSSGELVNPVAFTAGTTADLTQYTYVQTKDLYEAQSDETFTFTVNSSDPGLLDIAEHNYTNSNAYYNYAKTGETVDVPSGTTAGWIGQQQDYYLSNITAVPHRVEGLTWYNTSSAALQLNELNVTYDWVAIY